MTIRNRYGKSLAAEDHELKNRADKFRKIRTNASRLLNRIGDLVQVDIPRESDGNVINLYYHSPVANDFRQPAKERIEKTLKCTFDSKGVAEVKFSRITAIVTLRVSRPRRKGKNLFRRSRKKAA